MITALLFIGALILILASAELFTNGVEWLGRRFELGEGAVGSVLAAVGTALPETLIPIIAILFTGTASADEIGIGAILGAPFMLSSLAMFVTGTAVLVFALRGRRARHVTVNEGVMRRDLSYFLLAYALAMAAGLLPLPHVKWVLSPLLLVGYGFYVYRTLQAEGDLEGETKPLYFHRHPEIPHRWRIVAQVIVATLGMIAGAKIFVDQVNEISLAIGADALVISLLISPIATELPEKFNSVLWVRQRKDTLALGNITGAMVFQSTFPVSVGLLFTAWDLSRNGLIAGLFALISGAVFYLTLRLKHTLTWWSLCGAGTMYAAYIVYVLLFVV
jgi:cation:H+ antiporter